MTSPQQYSQRVRKITSCHHIAGSNAVFEALEDEHDEITWAKVLCGSCSHRLFDLNVTLRTVWYPGEWDDYPVNESFLVLSRLCPSCRTRNERDVTMTPGVPLGDDGAWKCSHCAKLDRGGYLGRIESPRGRVIVRCRCKNTVRVTAAHVYNALAALNDLKR